MTNLGPEQMASTGTQMRNPSAVAKSLRWVLNNIKDEGPQTFTHAIHGYVGEAIKLLEIEQSDSIRDYEAEGRVDAIISCYGIELSDAIFLRDLVLGA